MNVIWYKIWYDLWENRGRTLRVVLIIAVGAFAVGTVMNLVWLLIQDLNHNWLISAPATIALEVSPPIDDAMLQTLENMPEVEVAIGWMQQKIQWRAQPSDDWQPAYLIAVDDYEAQPIRKIVRDVGDWPTRKLMGVQRKRGLTVNDQVYMEIKNQTYQVGLNGILYNPATPPIIIQPEPTFFTTRQRFEQLTGEPHYSLVLLTIPNYSDERVKMVADLVQNELEKQNIEVSPAMPLPGGFKSRTAPADRYVYYDLFEIIFYLLNSLAVLCSILGMFLVYNTINAIIAQQIQQIGIMKAIGARFHHIVQIYLSLVIVYGVLALMISLPLAALVSNGMRYIMITYIVTMIAAPFNISIPSIIMQIIAAFIFPLLISILPIWDGSHITVREAIASYGLGGTSSTLDKVLSQLEALPRMVALTISNTFRNKKRVILTQISLIGAGAIFITVTSLYASMVHTFSDVVFSIIQANVLLDLKEPQRIEEISRLALSQPEVKTIEMWTIAQGKAHLQSLLEGNSDHDIKLRGLPVPSLIYVPDLRQGRWLVPTDHEGMVLNQALATNLGVGVGDWLTVKITGKRDSQWQVIGLVFEPLEQATAFVVQPRLQYITHQSGQGQAIYVQTYHTDADIEAAVAAKLHNIYENRGYEVVVTLSDTAHKTVFYRLLQLAMALTILSLMTGITALVGTIALSGTLSINVLDRTREIGMMRAIGASSRAISGQFIGEGLMLGWLSWLVAIPLSVPMCRFMLYNMGHILNVSIVYKFSVTGMGSWFVIITFLAIIASWFPARKAANTSVRDSLSYA